MSRTALAAVVSANGTGASAQRLISSRRKLRKPEQVLAYGYAKSRSSKSTNASNMATVAYNMQYTRETSK